MRMLALALPLAIAVSMAEAQNALDANLHANEGKANPSSTAEDYRARNLVVTGNVAGGRGFRGNVGYTAEGDFRGATGGDASIQFRRNSALSSPSLAKSQSANDTFSMMRDAGAMEYRRDYVGTSRRGATGSAPVSTTRQRLDQESNRLSTERLLSLDTASNPMARYQSRTGDTGSLTASTVRGVKRESDRLRRGADGLSLYESARLQEDLRKGLLRMDAVRSRPLTPFEVSASTDAVRSNSVRPMTAAEMSVSRVDSRLSPYDAAVVRIERNWKQQQAKRIKPTTPVAQPEAEKPSEPAEGTGPTAGGKADGAETPDGSGDLSRTYQALRQDLDRRTRPADAVADSADEAVDTGPQMTADEYALLLRHGTKLDAFGDGGKHRLDQLLSEGQRALNEGNNFIAEKRFEVALLLKQDDPRATAGLLHCQIGANLTGSAALTLRKLFTQSPEMMDVTYAPQALPQRSRMVKALEAARLRLQGDRDVAEYGLLTAYIGRLLDDRQAIEQGLAAVKGTPGDDILGSLLRKLWLEPPPEPVNDLAVPAAEAPAPSTVTKSNPETPVAPAAPVAEPTVPDRPATTP